MMTGIATLPLICGITLGFFVPFAANVIPIRRALGRALREVILALLYCICFFVVLIFFFFFFFKSLDLYHVSSEEVTVTFMKTEHLGISPWQVL